MKELKSVRFNVGMYDDIKLKIVDTMKERDLIHYCLTRFIVLAGKVNMDGYLFVNGNMPYTIETLAIEFNRTIEEIELSVKALIDLEILELTEHKTYKVKNWTKHQGMKKKSNEDSYEKNDNSQRTLSKYGDELLISKSIDENKNLNKGRKELLELISEEDISEFVNNSKKIVEANSLKDGNDISKENNIHSKDNAINEKIIFELKDEINNGFKFNNEKELIISKEIMNSDLKNKPDKVELKKKRGRRGRPKKSSNINSKTRNLKKDNSLIKFSCDEYEDDGFNVKDDEFVTFTIG